MNCVCTYKSSFGLANAVPCASEIVENSSSIVVIRSVLLLFAAMYVFC